MSRQTAITEKISTERTGLRSSIFVHVALDSSMNVDEVSFSQKWKDEGTLDKVLSALGDTVTAIVRAVREARNG